MKKKYWYLIIGLIGAFIILVLPVFPVPVPDYNNPSVNVLSFWKASHFFDIDFKVFAGMELIGFIFGTTLFGVYDLIKISSDEKWD